MITVKNVTKRYGKFKAIDNISFEINDGEIVGLLGPNGAGKSTTMNILTGFIEPTEGEVIINGYNISKKTKKAKKCIGYMPEGVPLYKDMTVKEFVTYMAELKGVKKGIATLDDEGRLSVYASHHDAAILTGIGSNAAGLVNAGSPEPLVYSC